MKNRILTFIRTLANPRGWAYGLFWSWNIVFVAFMLLGFAPNVLPDMLTGVQAGSIPTAFLVIGAILAAIPLIAVTLGLTLLRRSPFRLLALGYGIEGPLMFIVAIRFFLLREANAAVAVLMAVTVLGMATLLWELLDRRAGARGALLGHWRVVGLSLFLLIALYGGLWIAFYAVPLAVQIGFVLGGLARAMWNGLLTFDWRSLSTIQWGMVPLAVLGGILTIYTVTLFAGAPIAVPTLAIWAWRRGARAFAARYSARRAAALTAVPLIVGAALIVLTNQQPQHQAFALLKNPPMNADQAQALRHQEETLRAGLLNAYLAPFRYLSAVGEVQVVSNMYQQSLHFSEEQAAEVEQLHDAVARPLLYEPVESPPFAQRVDGSAFRDEPLEAAKLYRAYFDQRIVDGEHDTIVNAVRSTWQASQAEAAWQAVDDREVRLLRQEVNIVEKGDWAEVELYEVYQNQTSQRQEVVYYFSLPESAAITGLWLGSSADRNARLAYRVSPRGAAQAVYRNEVRRNMDPALIEQIGPRQYRLRAFPVEPKQMRFDPVTNRATVKEGPPLHLWLTFQVLANNNGWTMPRLAERRNVYWDAATERRLNGKPMNVNLQDWLPSSVAATTPVKPAAHRVDFPDGKTVIVQPMSSADLPKPTANLRLAIVLDRSRSMSKYSADARVTLARLSQIGGALTDIYLTSSEYHGEAPSRIYLSQLQFDNIQYMGGQNAGELLAQFTALRGDQTYDAIFVITDGTGYELGESSTKFPIPNAPVWVIHLGDNLPLGYDDTTLEAIQASGGGVTGNVEDALARLAVASNPQALALPGVPADATAGWVDGYAWFTTAALGMPITADKDFAALAARWLILAETQRQRRALGSVTTLDQLHALAVKHSVVTPYSSMIVLVDSRQQQLLNQLEAQGDRFQREVEDVGDTVAQTAPLVVGVPEPEEWLLLALAAAMLMGYVYVTRLAPRRVRGD
jgi:putative PEP-CTERM system integral membrane protein